jgi:hypothetical protein
MVLFALQCSALAAVIPVINGDFETFDVPGVLDPTLNAHWASEPGANGIVGDLDTNDEYWTSTAGNARCGIPVPTTRTTIVIGIRHPTVCLARQSRLR